jgi:PLP dependent protein
MTIISQNIREIRSQLPETVCLVAVSKTKPVNDIREAYDAGQRIFGENRVQELLAKQPLLPADIKWHLIGHLQTNKVRSIVPIVSMVESVDSLRLLEVIDSEASKKGRVIDCLLQFHIASEETKYGFLPGEISSVPWKDITGRLHNVRICGVMGMATYTSDEEKVASEFRNLKGIFSALKNSAFAHLSYFTEISMGMSGDYQIAVKEGSTIVRIGSLIFGSRLKI